MLSRDSHTIGDMQTMGDRIRQLRIARGYSQEALAEVCGVTRGAVSQWEIGSTANVKLKTFMVLAETLGTDFAYLIYGPDRRPSVSPVAPAPHSSGTR